METITSLHGDFRSEAHRFGRFLLGELRPKGRLLTPFNLITSALILTTVVLLTIRFTRGLGAITNLSQDVPWGLWIGFDVVTGVALAGGAYVITFMVYILRLEKYEPIVRVTVLNGFLAYVFYAGALLLDLGRPWNVINPIIGNSFGVSSVLFLVAWHFLLYMTAEFLEFSPVIAEWAGWPKLRRRLHALTLGAVVLGISLSILHQSGLGALYLMAKGKIHPLWYSEFIPVLFLVSSIFAGLSMVMFEGTISHHVFRDRLGKPLQEGHDSIVIGLARICAGTMFAYLGLQVITFVHQGRGGMARNGVGHLVSVRSDRPDSAAGDRVCARCPAPQSGLDSDGSDPDAGRGDHQPPQRHGDRIPMDRAGPIRTLMAGSRGDPGCDIRRDLGVPLGREPDAGARLSRPGPGPWIRRRTCRDSCLSEKGKVP